MGMEEKRYKVYIVIFVITTVIASCVAVYFGIASFKGNEENTSLQEKVNELNADNEILKNKESETKTEIVEKEVVKEKTITLDFDTDINKCLNKDEYITKYLLSSIDSETFINNLGFCELLPDKKTIKIKIYKDVAKSIYPYINVESDITEEISFEREVKQIFFAMFGHSVGREKLYILFEDGTIEVLDLPKAIEENNLKIFKKLSDVKNVEKIVSARGGSELGGGATVLAFTSEGTFYDLANVK